VNDCVIDASALVLALAGKTDAAEALRERFPEMRRHAPHVIDAEVGNVLRRHEQAGRISVREADTALRAAGWLIDDRYPHAGMLARRAWSLRHNVSFTMRSTWPWRPTSTCPCSPRTCALASHRG
jgi:predicted nucleic acid-binding protein